jgi:hypothetical protein
MRFGLFLTVRFGSVQFIFNFVQFGFLSIRFISFMFGLGFFLFGFYRYQITKNQLKNIGVF